MAAAQRLAYKLFVAKLPWTAGRETLAEHFQQFGKVVFSKVIFDHETGRSKRYGFVVFESPDALETALAEKDHSIDGNKIVVQVMTSDNRNRRKDVGESEV